MGGRKAQGTGGRKAQGTGGGKEGETRKSEDKRKDTHEDVKGKDGKECEEGESPVDIDKVDGEVNGEDEADGLDRMSISADDPDSDSDDPAREAANEAAYAAAKTLVGEAVEGKTFTGLSLTPKTAAAASLYATIEEGTAKDMHTYKYVRYSTRWIVEQNRLREVGEV